MTDIDPLDIPWRWGGLEATHWEYAEYNGHALAMRHTGLDLRDECLDRCAFHLGYIDGKYAVRDENLQKMIVALVEKCDGKPMAKGRVRW